MPLYLNIEAFQFMIIGIDLSTTVSGLAISDNKKILNATAIDISKESSYDGKANLIISKIDEWILKYNNITVFNIEGALNAFAFGKTNTMTIIKLVKTNAVISYILEKKYPDIRINLLNMNTARKNLFGKCRIKGVKSKPFVKMMIESTNPEIIQFYIPMKSSRCKNENVLNQDIRDAAVMALV